MSGPALVWGVVLQTEPSIDPNVVKPGWTPLLVTGLLMLALAFLFFSMRKQMSRIQMPKSSDTDADGTPGSGAGRDLPGGATGTGVTGSVDLRGPDPEQQRAARPKSG